MRTSQHRTILYFADGNPNDQFTGTVHRDWRSDLGAAISWMISEGCAFPTLESKTVKRRRVYFCCVSSAIAALALFLGAALAQTDPAHKPTQTPGAADSQQSPGAVVRVHTDLVSIPVTVSDALNRFVLGLEKNDFQLFEDGEEQNVAFFSGEDAPLSVGLLFDESGSMSFKLRTSRDATAQLLNALSQEDEAFLVEFADLARVSVGFTGHTEAIRSALKNAQAGGLTAMLDAINTGLLEMNNAKNSRKAIVIVSDGGDNRSHYTAAQIESLVREANVQIYAMGVFDPLFSVGLTPEEISGPHLLSEIAAQTGGRAYAAALPSDLPSVATRIAVELRNQYVLGYYPKNKSRDGTYRKVDVQVAQRPNLGSPLKLHWRHGYYAPAQ